MRQGYSQNSEDEIIYNYFKQYRLIGNLLSIGENDGETLSNTRRLLDERAWSGVLYEPSPIAFAKLAKLYEDRERITCIQAAVADYNGEATFYESGEHLGTGDTSLLSTLDAAETERWGGMSQFTPITVPVVDAADIQGHFQLVCIDAEGWDLRILKRLNLSGVMMICVEFNGNDKQEFDHLARAYGLKLIHQNSENLIFAK